MYHAHTSLLLQFWSVKIKLYSFQAYQSLHLYFSPMVVNGMLLDWLILHLSLADCEVNPYLVSSCKNFLFLSVTLLTIRIYHHLLRPQK